MRNAAATMHQRDALMDSAFNDIGSLPMATIDKYRELKVRLRGSVARVWWGSGMVWCGVAPPVPLPTCEADRPREMPLHAQSIKWGLMHHEFMIMHGHRAMLHYCACASCPSRLPMAGCAGAADDRSTCLPIWP